MYQACAGQWPEDRAFWETIAQQEHGHSQAFGKMRRMVQSNPGQFQLISPVNPVALDAFIARINEVTEKVRLGEYDRLRILSVASDIEQSVLESKFPEAIKTANPAYLEMQAKIIAETRQHREALVARINQAKET